MGFTRYKPELLDSALGRKKYAAMAMAPNGAWYHHKEVDAAISELLRENERLSNALDKERSEIIKYMDELCNAKNEIERLTIDKRNVELMADAADSAIEKLKKKMDDSHLMPDIRRAKIKELKRALYKACANWARSERYTEATWHGDAHREEQWANVQAKCLAKAEEYK